MGNLEKYILEEFLSSLKESLFDFLSNDKFLLENDIHEQTISAKIACYLEKYLGDYLGDNNLNIDCEYNKSGKDPKVFKGIISKFLDGNFSVQDKDNNIIDNSGRIILLYEKKCLALINEGGGIIIGEKVNNHIIKNSERIRPDIIIHDRGNNTNICIFEIKKKKLSSEDILKLRGFTDKELNFGYKYGIGLSNFTKKSIQIDLYIDGKHVDKEYFKLENKINKTFNGDFSDIN